MYEFTHKKNKLKRNGAGEMPLAVRALAALPEDSGLIPNTHTVAHPQDMHCSLLEFLKQYTHVVHRHTCRKKTHTYKIIINLIDHSAVLAIQEACTQLFHFTIFLLL